MKNLVCLLLPLPHVISGLREFKVSRVSEQGCIRASAGRLSRLLEISHASRRELAMRAILSRACLLNSLSFAKEQISHEGDELRHSLVYRIISRSPIVVRTS